MGFAEHFLHTYVDTCFSSYLPPVCNHCSDEVWPIQKKIMWDGGFNGKTSFIFYSAKSFLLLPFDKPWFVFFSEAWTMVDCAFFITWALLLSVTRLYIGKSLFCPLWIKHEPWRTLKAFHASWLFSCKKRSSTNKQAALFVLSLKSQFLPLNVYTFQSRATCLASWEPSAGDLRYFQEDLKMDI